MRSLRVAFFILVVMLLAAPVWSQQEILIDGTTPVAGPGNTIGVGQNVRIHLRYRNLSDSSYHSANAFRVYSPDGATWAPTDQVGNVVLTAPNNTGVQVDSTGAISKAEADIFWMARGYGCDGVGDDTVAVAFINSSIPASISPHFDDRVISLIVYTGGSENLGKHICVDSAMRFPPSNMWRWNKVYPGDIHSIVPTWGGLQCYTIVSTGLPPDFSNIPAQIAGEHCSPSVSYDFDAVDPEGGPVTFRLESGPGSINDYTGVWTASGLTPGSYTITVGVANGVSGGDVETVPVIITNDPPVGDAPGGSYLAVAGIPVKRPIFVSDACDPVTLGFIDVDGPDGLVTLDSGNVVTFTPSVKDAGHVIVQLQAIDQYGAADTIDLDYDVVVCGIRVGNIDCDLNDQVDVSDLTRLIDFLFLTQTPLCSGMKSSGEPVTTEAEKK